MATALTETRRRDVSPIEKFANQLDNRLTEFKKVLPSHISPDKFQRTVLTAIQSDPALLQADRQSLILACMKAAQDGLLPDKREAALVIFKERRNENGQWVEKQLVQYMPMVYGLRKKILQTEEITDLVTKVVYLREAQEGYFVYEEGTDAMLRHRPMLDLSGDDTTDDKIVAAYSMATFANGGKSYEVMRRFEIDRVRETSMTGATRDRNGKPRTPKGPWVDWFPEMARKTVMRRHAKTLPMSGDLLDVEARDEEIFAASATDTLAAGTPDAPRAIDPPTRDDVEPGVDPGTGEVVDEETNARAVDREIERAAAGGGNDDDDQIDNANDDDDDASEPWQGMVDGILARIAQANIVGDVIAAEGDFAKHRELLPEHVVAQVDSAARDKREALKRPRA